MQRDLRGKAVLVTGGRTGIGLATGLAFGARGAHVTLTCRWGSAEEEETAALFAEVGAPKPCLVEANVAAEEDTEALLAVMAERHDDVYAFVSNVGLAELIRDFSDYNLKGLCRSIEYSAWPLLSHLQAIRTRFGRWPRYAVALSSCGPDEYYPNYDFAAASKSVIETLVRYAAQRLFREDCRVNALRARWVDTASLKATMGAEFVPFVESFDTPGLVQTPAEVADVAVAMCSGWLDGMRGQVLTVDHGTRFYDNLMRLYADRDRLDPTRR